MATTCNIGKLDDVLKTVKVRYNPDFQTVCCMKAIFDDAEKKSKEFGYGEVDVDAKFIPNSSPVGRAIRLKFSADKLWMKEFGTGYVGKDAYPNSRFVKNLKKTVKFYAWGEMQYVKGYKYFYKPKMGYTPTTKWDISSDIDDFEDEPLANEPYWVHDGNLYFGDLPGAEIYYYSWHLKSDMPKIVRGFGL